MFVGRSASLKPTPLVHTGCCGSRSRYGLYCFVHAAAAAATAAAADTTAAFRLQHAAGVAKMHTH